MQGTIEETPTSATFVLTVGLLYALKQEASRRKVSVSELVRDLLKDAVFAVEQEAMAS